VNAYQIRNFDFECYQNAVREQRTFQQDWLKNGYAPKGFYVKDFCLLPVEDTFHLFHIAGTPGVSCCLPGNEVWFGHAFTNNFQHWETLEPCLYISAGQWDGGHVFAPFVIEKDGMYLMFYTGCRIDNTQRIGVAISRDLIHWEKYDKNPVITPENYDWAFCPTTGGASCRDPHVCKYGDDFSLYYTAVTNQGKACVARASSEDLLSWTDQGPVYTYPNLTHCESSNVQELDGKHLLFFGGHIEYWSYVVSDNPYHWSDQKPVPIGKNITAMEVLKRLDPLWLVAYFELNNYRLFLGTIDWSLKHPQIERITNKHQLKYFGF